MRRAEVPLEAVQEYAVKERVCIRPLLRRVIDRETGEAVLVDADRGDAVEASRVVDQGPFAGSSQSRV